MSKAFKHYLVSISLISLSMLACNSEVTSTLESKATALGVMNEIVVVADQDLWESAVGDTFKYYFESPYPLMPTPEAMFDIRHFTGEQIQNEVLRRQLRTYTFLADLNDEESIVTKMVRKDMGEEKYMQAKAGNKPGTSIGRDKWARGQVLVYLAGNGHDDLSHLIRSRYPAIAKRINEHDNKQLESTVYAVPVNKGLSEKIKTEFGMDVQIPSNFKIAKEQESDKLLWLRKDTKKGIMNMVMQRLPYTGEEQFDKEYIKGIKNEFGKSFVSSTTEGSYLRVHDEQLPVLEYTQEINGMYAKELRGVWEMTDDFMAGPFVSYLIHNKTKQELLFIDAFVFAPGEQKRNMIQELEFIVKSMKG